MVKNAGGNKSKGFARKGFNKPENKSTLRLSQDELEIYCSVTKILGDSMCYVHGIEDGIQRLCHIRGKFKGRGKRDNFASNNSWVLVGIRDYETIKENKLQNCDLLEVYSDIETIKLKSLLEPQKVESENICFENEKKDDNLIEELSKLQNFEKVGEAEEIVDFNDI